MQDDILKIYNVSEELAGANNATDLIKIALYLASAIEKVSLHGQHLKGPEKLELLKTMMHRCIENSELSWKKEAHTFTDKVLPHCIDAGIQVYKSLELYMGNKKTSCCICM